MDAKYAMYQTDKLEPGLTGTIATYLAKDTNSSTNVHAVTLTDGTVLCWRRCPGRYTGRSRQWCSPG